LLLYAINRVEYPSKFIRSSLLSKTLETFSPDLCFLISVLGVLELNQAEIKSPKPDLDNASAGKSMLHTTYVV